MNVTRIHFLLVLTLALSLVLTACSGEPPGNAAAAVPQVEPPVSRETNDDQPDDEQASQPYWVEGQPQLDEQGAVSVEITPLNLNNAWESIDFQVALNTHSVDLSMDLAALATLVTDTGHIVQASRWDAPLGGHHVSGELSFPVSAQAGSVLEGAKKITITLVDVDAPERIFVWERGG